MATKQVAAPAFPFAVSISENTADQFATPGALLVSQEAPSAVNISISGVSSTSAIGYSQRPRQRLSHTHWRRFYICGQCAQHRNR